MPVLGKESQETVPARWAMLFAQLETMHVAQFLHKEETLFGLEETSLWWLFGKLSTKQGMSYACTISLFQSLAVS